MTRSPSDWGSTGTRSTKLFGARTRSSGSSSTMAERVFELFDDFAAAWARGERPSLDYYLEQAGGEADALARLVDEYVSRAPAPPPREDAVEVLDAFLAREPGLVALRARRGVRVDDVVDALVDSLS